MNIYVQDYLYWKVIPMATIFILIPLLLAIFYSIIGKKMQIKKRAQIFPSYMKIYGFTSFYVPKWNSKLSEPICFFVIVFIEGWILISSVLGIPDKAARDGVNVKTKEFLAQYDLAINIMFFTLLSFGISLLIIITLQLMNFLKDQSKIKKIITKEYLQEWSENIKKEKFLDTFKNTKWHLYKKHVLKIEEKFIDKVNILKVKSNVDRENLQEIHKTLSNYLLKIDRIFSFYNLKKRKQLINYHYLRAVKILQTKLT